MTAWFRRQHDAAPAPEPEPDDSPAVLTRTLGELVAFINRSAGRLPAESVVAARLVTDTVQDVIDTAENGTLDIHAGLSAKAILQDYLPTTLRAYLALDPATVRQPAGDGRTPDQSLLDQLTSLLSGAEDVRAAARSRDVDALVSQGSFLRTKFTGSDLDL
ncbi:MAG TPA: hypothetical protein VGN35_04050 [Jatrophihabitantaceae bacterium]|jgi:hypothetical protein|nr:hypothetical protein [Jatrophihabitantaceae bacterium]